jgi:pimeloyl-ACP methyl ester carboxylesterase
MKTKLLLSILVFGTLFQINAQETTTIIKPSPTDSKKSLLTLKLSDKLETKYAIGLENNLEKNSLITQTKLPYPIIFIHGLNSSSSTWDTTRNFLTSTFGLTDGGFFDVNLNYDGSLLTSNKTTDSYLYYSNTNAVSGGDIYFVNFAVNTGGVVFLNSNGTINDNCLNLSNQSAIAKQGYILKDIIMSVMQLTGKNKVVLMGHSMGGLASREYLQNSSNWQLDGLHHIAKLATTGTPHGGSDAIGGQVLNVDYSSEAIRDLKKISVYLEGGYESSVSSSYYNRDVNCNGISNDGLNIIGLNQRTLSTSLDYSCVIGTGLSILGVGGDGAVTISSANLNLANSGYSNLIPNIFSVYKIHNFLPSDWYTIMQSIDEPNEFPIAYGISLNNPSVYYGFNSEQSPSSPYVNGNDYDDYKFSVSSNSNVTVLINKPTSLNLNARLVSSTYNQIGSSFSNNGGSSINFTTNNLPQGVYYLEIYGLPTPNTISQYSFSLSSTLSNPDFTSASSLEIYPNPTSSKVFFDNSIEKFETATVVNYLGQVVAETRFSTFESNQEVDLSSFSAGVYIVKFANGDKSITKKVIKE